MGLTSPFIVLNEHGEFLSSRIMDLEIHVSIFQLFIVIRINRYGIFLPIMIIFISTWVQHRTLKDAKTSTGLFE